MAKFDFVWAAKWRRNPRIGAGGRCNYTATQPGGTSRQTSALAPLGPGIGPRALWFLEPEFAPRAPPLHEKNPVFLEIFESPKAAMNVSAPKFSPKGKTYPCAGEEFGSALP